MSDHSQGWAIGDDGLFHYVKWIPSSHAKAGGHWNGITWCSYALEPDTPSGIFIRCHGQTVRTSMPVNCLRCASRTPGDPRPWG